MENHIIGTEHLIGCEHMIASYMEDLYSQRQSVLITYENPQERFKVRQIGRERRDWTAKGTNGQLSAYCRAWIIIGAHGEVRIYIQNMQNGPSDIMKEVDTMKPVNRAFLTQF